MARYVLDYDYLAKRIKDARKSKGWTQSVLAEKADVSNNTIAKLEIGYTTVSLKTILTIANVLDVDINYLLGGTPNISTIADGSFIDELMRDFDEKDKEFLVQIITALRAYRQ
ncbi:MAG: helix-turn-helix domain-containing protein [Defluviitaleaceae bacterium]|nr:helix-turn-helix domain-containing protein [Defluviitaleaceae bacterium]